jgi:hypothetical protein
MAGAVTHMLVAERAAQLARIGNSALSSLLCTPSGTAFLFMGAVSPDLPYLGGMLSGEGKWADRMHYQRTNLVPCGAAVTPGLSDWQNSLNHAFIAWLAGYVSHCVADAVVHPVVNLIVGPYSSNKVAHRQCEMYQDALLFRELKKQDLRGSHFVNSLRCCEDDDACASVAENWGAGLRWAYRRPTQPDTLDWLHWYRRAVTVASDVDLIYLLSRPFRGADTLLYQSTRKLWANERLCRKYYSEVPVPPEGVSRVAFADGVFSRAVDRVQQSWDLLWKDILGADQLGADWSKGQMQAAVRNWDLDTGIDQDLPGSPITCWQDLSPF